MTHEMGVLPHCEFSRTNLVIHEITTHDEWLEIGRTLRTMEGAIVFWIGDWLKFGTEHGYVERAKYDFAEKATGFARGRLQNAAWLASHVEFSRRREHLSIGHHEAVASLEPAEQTKWLDMAENNQWKRSKLRQEIRDMNKREVALPEGKFQVLYADPPWEYSNSGFSQSAALQYQTMATEDICAKPIQPLAAEDSVLFLWVTSPQLLAGTQVMQSWGFSYQTMVVWVKSRAPGMGWFVNTKHELLLIGTKGAFQPKFKPDSVVEADVERHSQKPDVFYELVEKMYPDTTKLELFARRPRTGWSSWGNEVMENDDDTKKVA